MNKNNMKRLVLGLTCLTATTNCALAQQQDSLFDSLATGLVFVFIVTVILCVIFMLLAVPISTIYLVVRALWLRPRQWAMLALAVAGPIALLPAYDLPSKPQNPILALQFGDLFAVQWLALALGVWALVKIQRNWEALGKKKGTLQYLDIACIVNLMFFALLTPALMAIVGSMG